MMEEAPLELKKPRCHSMMENNEEISFMEEEKNAESFLEEEEKETFNKKISEPLFKPKDPMMVWQSYENERICNSQKYFLFNIFFLVILAVKNKILEGKCLEAFDIIQKNFPNLTKEFPKLEIYLNVQHFIELIKEKKHVEAITFAKSSSSFNEGASFIALKDNKIEEISLDVCLLLIYFLAVFLDCVWVTLLFGIRKLSLELLT